MAGYVALAYNRLDSHSLTYNRAPYGKARLGALTADLEATQANLGGRARVELQVASVWPHPAARVAADVREAVTSQLARLAAVQADAVSVTVDAVVRTSAPERARVR